jgi:hypothetical protein
MRREDALARQRARRRAVALAARLRSEVGRVLDGGAGPDDPTRPSAQRLRLTVDALDRALRYGLEFGFTPDPDLGRTRGHVRNLVLLVRRNLGSAWITAPPDQLLKAARLADELIGTVGWIDQRVPAAGIEDPAGSWSATWSARLLRLAAVVLPTGHRRDFIEDGCGNLALAESRREWAGYLLGLVVHLPTIAAAARAAARRGGEPAP